MAINVYDEELLQQAKTLFDNLPEQQKKRFYRSVSIYELDKTKTYNLILRVLIDLHRKKQVPIQTVIDGLCNEISTHEVLDNLLTPEILKRIKSIPELNIDTEKLKNYLILVRDAYNITFEDLLKTLQVM